jgi:ribonuclease J
VNTSSNQFAKILKNPEGLSFVPLGGCGEIGMNANFYCCDGQWLMVDNGITFSRSPDMVLMTDIRNFVVNIDLANLKGLFVTHAHEDHVGAVAYLWGYLKCPLYATPFTAYILEQKLKELGLKVPVNQIPLLGRAQVGPFNIEFVSLTHSIPEPNALMIRTPHGNIFHTGDWKIDPKPVIGQAIDVERMMEIGREGVLALVCDSTNVFENGASGSEGDVENAIYDVVASCTGRVVISCFSSNLARIHSCYKAAIATKRKVCLVGRSLQRMVDAARHCGYFDHSIQFIPVEEVRNHTPASVMILTTGSQAEPRAALTRMSNKDHPFITLGEHDTVIFSSRVIPGNQESIAALQNRLVLQNVKMITYKEGLHVSGHPCRDELAQMYDWLQPKIVIPVHGEAIHLKEHASFALSKGVPQALVPQNGNIFHLSPGPVKCLGNVPTGRLALDGRRLIEYTGSVVTQRRELLDRGSLFVFVVLSSANRKILSRTVMSHGVFEYEDERESVEGQIKNLISEVYSEALSQGDLKKRSKNSKTPESKLSNPQEAGEIVAPPAESSKSSTPTHIIAARKVRNLFYKKWGVQPVVRIHSVWVEQILLFINSVEIPVPYLL